MRKTDERFLEELKFELSLKDIDVVYDINEDKKIRNMAYFKKSVAGEEQKTSFEVDSIFRMKEMYEGEMLYDPKTEIAATIDENLRRKLPKL